MDVDNKMILTVAASVVSAGLGFGLASWAPWATSINENIPLISHADCGVTSTGDIEGVNLSLRCGLNRAGWEEIVAGYLEGLDLDAIRNGRDPTQAQLDAWGAKMGSIDAVQALLADIKAGEISTAANALAPFRPTSVELNAMLLPAQDGTDTAPLWLARTPAQPAPPPAPPAPATPEGQAVLDGAVASCGIAALRDIRDAAIEVDCGATADDIDKVIAKVVAESGAESLIALLEKDAAQRDRIVQDLARLAGVDADLMDALLTRMQAAGGSATDGSAADIDTALHKRMHQAVVLVRMGAIAGFLAERQAEAADAIATGDADALDSAFSSAAVGLRRLADDLAPPEVSDIAAVALFIDTAEDLLAEGDPFGAILSIEDASRTISSARPAMARALELAALDILAAPEWRETLRDRIEEPAYDPQKVAAQRQLLIVEEMRDDALTLGISAANLLLDRSDTALDTATLDDARTTLDQIARFVDSGTEHARVAQLERARSTIRLQDYQRSGDLQTLQEANDLAETALTAALNIDPAWALPYQTNLGLARMRLGRMTGDRDALNEALDAFKVVADSRSSDTDLRGWASAQNNVAAALQSLAAEGDLSYYEDSVAVFRQIAHRMDEVGFREEWAFYTRNLAKTLTTLGAEARSPARLREAARALDSVLTYEQGRGMSRALVETQEQLAWVWSQIAVIETNAGAFDRADGLISDVITVYREANLPIDEIEAERQRLDFRWNRGIAFDDAALIAAAADGYGILVDRALGLGIHRHFVNLSIRQARATREANRNGVVTQGPTPLQIVERARNHVAALDPQTVTMLGDLGRDLDALFRDLR